MIFQVESLNESVVKTATPEEVTVLLVILFFFTLISSSFIAYYQAKQTSPVGHNGTPEDIAGLVSYLASKEARLVTGMPSCLQFYKFNI